MDELTDEELLVLYKHGRNDAFDQLYLRHRQGLFLYLLRMCRDRLGAEEMMQDVLFKVARSAGDYEPRGRFRPWLFRIAANHCLNVLDSGDQKRQGRLVLLSDFETRGDARVALTTPDDPAHRVEATETREAIGRALASLDERQRSAFLLFEVAGLSGNEVASAMGIPVGTVKTWLHRGRERLRRALGRERTRAEGGGTR